LYTNKYHNVHVKEVNGAQVLLEVQVTKNMECSMPSTSVGTPFKVRILENNDEKEWVDVEDDEDEDLDTIYDPYYDTHDPKVEEPAKEFKHVGTEWNGRIISVDTEKDFVVSTSIPLEADRRKFVE
jgi:hypothetical protein